MTAFRRGAAAACLVHLVLLIFARSAGAQSTVVLSGRVLDARSMAPIFGATVVADARDAVTDGEGRFTLSVAPGTVSLRATATGYFPETRALDVAAGSSTLALEILLVSSEPVRESVEVRGQGAPGETPPATTAVSPLEVRRVAGAVENIYRVLQTLPGVSATDEIGSRLTVRGGGPDQNLTLLDGVEIHNPYRLFGLFSAFNPETVENFQLTAGGFGVQYGDRLSSLLVVENRPGTETRPFGGSFTLGLTDTNVVLEGQLPGRAAGSWLFTGRRTYYDLIVSRIVDQSLPSFADLQTTISWLPKPGQKVTLFAMRSREHTDAVFDRASSDERLALTTGASNDLAALSFFATIGSRTSSRTVVSWYRNVDGIGVDGRLPSDARRSNSQGASPLASTVFSRDLLLRDIAVRQELMFAAGPRHAFQAGGEFHGLDTGWAWSITGDRNPSAANGSSVRGGTGLPAVLHSTRRASRLGMWLTDRWGVGPRVTVEPGLRFDWSGINRQAVVSPRVAASVDLGRRLRLRAAGGLYTQSPGYEKLLQSDYFVDLSGTDRVDLASERSWHGIVGVERATTGGVRLRVESYYKKFDDLIVGRLETPAEVQARLASYDFPAELSSNLPAAPQITSNPVNGATGRAYGFDVFAARRGRSPSARLSGWASYTFGQSDLDAYGRRYPFDYDRRHAASLVGMFQVSRLIEVGVTVRVASGFPTTPVVGLRVAAAERTESGVTKLVPDRDANGLPVYTIDLGGVENLNSARLPVFARVDLRTTFRPAWMGRRWQLYVEIINVLNRQNAGSLQPTLEYDPTSDRPRVTYSRDMGIPRLPTFGVRCRF